MSRDVGDIEAAPTVAVFLAAIEDAFKDRRQLLARLAYHQIYAAT